jgi:hypothetical protein
MAIVTIGNAIAVAVAIHAIGDTIAVTIAGAHTGISARAIVGDTAGQKYAGGKQCYSKFFHTVLQKMGSPAGCRESERDF